MTTRIDSQTAGIENYRQANSAAIHLQTSLFAFDIGMLAFIGTSELQKEQPSLMIVVAAAFLVLSMFISIFAMYQQWRGIAEGSKDQLKEASKSFRQKFLELTNKSKSKNQALPEQKYDGIKATSRLFATSMSLKLAASLLVMYVILERAL